MEKKMNTRECEHDWADTPDGWQCKKCGVYSHEESASSQ